MIKRSHLRFDYLVTVLVTILFFILGLNGLIGLWEGILLFSVFILFNFYLFKSSKGGIADDKEVEAEIEQVKGYSWLISISLFSAGIIWVRTSG